MKLLVIGLGQCGSHIADEFARISRRARRQRRLEIVTGAFAVNTDLADLSGLRSIKADYNHRILIGGRKSGGHGVGKINELGAQIAREDSDKIIEAIRGTPHFHESDAFLLIAGAAGGTGSGAISVISLVLKERYLEKPVYNLVVLPFEHEEQTEERTIYNTATCLKSCNAVADAVFLVDNQRYLGKDTSPRANLDRINRMTVEPFYNILSAGEEKKARYIGSRVLDAGDIIQTIKGWSVIGHGSSRIRPAWLSFLRKSSGFREKGTSINRGIEAMDRAISELSLKCDPALAGRALYLAAAPDKEMNLTLIKELGEYIKSIARDTVIRDGDYPRQKGEVSVSVIFSELRDVEKIKRYYQQAAGVISKTRQRRRQIERKLKEIDEYARDVPSLI